MKKNTRNRKLIQVLLILLVALVGIYSVSCVLKLFADKKQVIVKIPENSLEHRTSINSKLDAKTNKNSRANTTQADDLELFPHEYNETVNENNPQKSSSIELYKNHSKENIKFHYKNMFPGDAKTQYDSIRITFHDAIDVRYKIVFHNDSDKLANVLKVRVVLPKSGAVLYDGLMRDMNVVYCESFYSAEKTTIETEYEIISYLDTSVGNAYQNESVYADFSWWTTQTQNLDSPDTGDTQIIFNLIAIAGVILVFMVIIMDRKRRRL